MTNPTQKLSALGQSLWLDNITREILKQGTLRHYIDELSVTGLTSNPTIYDQAVGGGDWYNGQIQELSAAGLSGDQLFFALAAEDLTQAADLFRPVYQRTNHLDGWVSLEVSPILAHDTGRTLDEVKTLHRQIERPNVFIKIPGTPEGLPAIEEAIFAGIPINVTLLFSAEQYLAAARAYQRGVERRIEKGLNPDVVSVASVFISRWDKAVQERVPAGLRNRLGIAIAGRTYRAYRELLGLASFGVPGQRRCPAPAAALGQHRNQGSPGLGRAVHRGPRRARYHQHHAGCDPARLCRSRADSWSHAGGWGRRRVGARRVRARGNRCKRAR